MAGNFKEGAAYGMFDSSGSFGSHRSESLLHEQEIIVVTPDSLKQDNRSTQARDSLTKWRTNRENKQLIAIEKCSDARSFEDNPESSIILPSIAASGPFEPFIKIYQDSRVSSIVNMSHYKGSSFQPGRNPNGCGGRALRGEQLKTNAFEEGDVDRYVLQYVPHSDVIINSCKRAQQIALTTTKPVLAAAQDHSEGRIFALGMYLQYREGKILSVDAGYGPYIQEGQYNPGALYAEGLPFLSAEEFPDSIEEFNLFQQFLRDNREHVRQLHLQFPDFRKAQEVQNPRAVILSSSIKPVRVRYPQTFRMPGTYFSIRFGRQRVEDIEIIDEESQKAALNQTHYPIAHSALHYGKSNQDFSKTDRVILETGDMDRSVKLAHELSKKPWMESWLQLPDHKIIIAQIRAGEINDIDYYKAA